MGLTSRTRGAALGRACVSWPPISIGPTISLSNATEPIVIRRTSAILLDHAPVRPAAGATMTLATRNLADFLGLGLALINPFEIGI